MQGKLKLNWAQVTDDDAVIEAIIDQCWKAEVEMLGAIVRRIGSTPSLPLAIDRHYCNWWTAVGLICAAVPALRNDTQGGRHAILLAFDMCEMRHARERALAIVGYKDIVAMSRMSDARAQWMGAVLRVAHGPCRPLCRAPATAHAEGYYHKNNGRFDNFIPPAMKKSFDIKCSRSDLDAYESELLHFMDYVLYPAFCLAMTERSVAFYLHALIRGRGLVPIYADDHKLVHLDWLEGRHKFQTVLEHVLMENGYVSFSCVNLFTVAERAAVCLERLRCERRVRTQQSAYVC